MRRPPCARPRSRPPAGSASSRRRGSIQEGAWADFIALPENPLESPTALRSIDFVMKGGVVVRDDEHLSGGAVNP